MADFTQELQKMMAAFTPQGGFGIQNLGGLQAMLGRQNERGLRGAIGSDMFNLQRQGMGRSVAGAFSGGTRRNQFSQSLMDALTQLSAKNSQLAGGQRQAMLSTFAPIAHQEANRPSFLSTLLGGTLGLGAKAFMPGLAGMLPNPQLKMLMELLSGGGGGEVGQGFASEDNFGFK